MMWSFKSSFPSIKFIITNEANNHLQLAIPSYHDDEEENKFYTYRWTMGGHVGGPSYKSHIVVIIH